MYDLIQHSKFIYEYQNCVSKEWCDYVSNILESGLQTEKITDKNQKRNNVSYNITQSKTKEIVAVNTLIHDKIGRANDLYVEQNLFLTPVLSELSLNLDTHDLVADYVYRKYDTNDDYEWHADKSLNKQFVLSYLLYLNDDFDGGNTLFLHERKKIIPRQGSIICFPCDLYMTHKSTKITKGVKRIIWTCLEINKKGA